MSPSGLGSHLSESEKNRGMMGENDPTSAPTASTAGPCPTSIEINKTSWHFCAILISMIPRRLSGSNR